mmetsp:Transcript_14002/g.40283  ORF Transcript_14002/g.40283 Transcript_14002/m.40283 type:complete len:200 (+) Transcript_14002:450-1049(+)
MFGCSSATGVRDPIPHEETLGIAAATWTDRAETPMFRVICASSDRRCAWNICSVAFTNCRCISHWGISGAQSCSCSATFAGSAATLWDFATPLLQNARGGASSADRNSSCPCANLHVAPERHRPTLEKSKQSCVLNKFGGFWISPSPCAKVHDAPRLQYPVVEMNLQRRVLSNRRRLAAAAPPGECGGATSWACCSCAA